MLGCEASSKKRHRSPTGLNGSPQGHVGFLKRKAKQPGRPGGREGVHRVPPLYSITHGWAPFALYAPLLWLTTCKRGAASEVAKLKVRCYLGYFFLYIKEERQPITAPAEGSWGLCT
jgi:hypothetical protein